MKPTADAPAVIDQARTALESVSRLMGDGRAEDLQACRPHLEQAARLLERALAAMLNERGRDPAGKNALDRFRREFRKARALHEHAGGFYGGLMRMLAPGLASGYSPRGEEQLPRLVRPGRRVSVEA
ncbi:MAG: hypothetical protein LAP39_02885 [Acidobacteriia bacterium]|nr:hypothetical protein [Terriglobia bacterium]